MERRALQSDVLFYALGAVGLGLTGLALGEFARQWQPVPVGMPMGNVLTYFLAAMMLAAGAAATTTGWRSSGLTGLAMIFAIWSLLKVPVIFSAPHVLGAWLGFAEAASLALAGLMAASVMSGVGGQRLLVGLRTGYGLCAVVFGLCHFVYVDITASMVPDWLPGRHFWAYLTGAGHLAAGFALVSGVLMRLAARMLGLMMGSFVLLVHVPDTIADPAGATACTIQFISLLLAGGAWLVGGALALQEEQVTLSPAQTDTMGLILPSRRAG